MNFWTNLIGYQAVWFASVAAAAHGLPWIGVGIALCFAAAQWTASPHKAADARLALLGVAAGIVVDGTLAAAGAVAYASASPALIAPLWILAMWVAFALTLNHSLAFLQARPAVAAVFGAIAAPLAYLGAERGFGAVAFSAPPWRPLSLLAIGWALALPLLLACARRWKTDAGATAGRAEPGR